MKLKIAIFFTSIISGSMSHAESSLVMYGITDSALTYVSNKMGNSSTELNSGNLNTSRLGFRGKEDLGGGLAAIFNLESSLGLDNGSIGSSSTFWNRQAWMGFSSKSWGDLRAGYQRPSFYDILGPLSHTPPFGAPAARIDGAAIAGTSLARFDNTIGTKRYANSLKYITPEMSGFKLHAFGALGEVAGSNSADRTWNLGLSYKNNSFTAGLSYLKTNCPGVIGCLANQSEDEVLGFGMGYSFGKLKVTGIYTKQKNAKTVKGNNAETASIAFKYPVRNWHFAAGYQILNDKTSKNMDVQQINLSAVYDLSKRTALYTILARQRVTNGGISGISFLSSSGSQNQFSLGLRHSF